MANKLIALKTQYPGADVFRVVARLPRLMLRSTIQIEEDAAKVRLMGRG